LGAIVKQAVKSNIGKAIRKEAINYTIKEVVVGGIK
jgi:hypothetical protein